jgi:hypothetical protein
MKNMYAGRRPKPQARSEGGKVLRQGAFAPKGAYDVKDAYLSGKAGGEAHPFYDRSHGKKR